MIVGQYVPPPGYERRYGAKDVNQWPSKKVYDDKTPRPTKWSPPKYGKGKDWMKPTPKPTKWSKPVKTPKPTYKKTPKPTYYKAPKTPKPTKNSHKSWPSKKYGHNNNDGHDVRAYSDEIDLTQIEKILLAEDSQLAIEEQLIIHGEDGEDRLFCDYSGCGCGPWLCPIWCWAQGSIFFVFTFIN
jgi:hypothetical protein